MLGFGGIAKRLFGSSNDRYVKSLSPLIAKINALEPSITCRFRTLTLLRQTGKAQGAL